MAMSARTGARVAGMHSAAVYALCGGMPVSWCCWWLLLSVCVRAFDVSVPACPQTRDYRGARETVF